VQISDVKHVLEKFLDQAVIGFPSSHGTAKEEVDRQDSEPLLSEKFHKKFLRLCKVKDRYSAAFTQTP
jgi:hypothetical protein